MGRRPNESEPTRWVPLIILLMGLFSCSVVYMFMTSMLRPTSSSRSSSVSEVDSLSVVESGGGNRGVSSSGCCRGIEKLELWGAAVKWGENFKLSSAEECCKACKAMCTEDVDTPCLCDTWVFCGNREACASKYGECWLKKQKDILTPDRRGAGDKVMWTSGIILAKGQGIVGLETEHGTLRMKLLPDCSPHSVAYILELLELHLCAGCRFYRAEGRGQSWNSEGDHIKHASHGPPFALIQGTLEVGGATFSKIPTEDCPTIRRGSVAWVGSGPEFFISLANHDEWKRSYTVFASVLPEDMAIAEKIAQLPTKSDVWNNINVSVLEEPVPLSFKRIKKS